MSSEVGFKLRSAVTSEGSEKCLVNADLIAVFDLIDGFHVLAITYSMFWRYYILCFGYNYRKFINLMIDIIMKNKEKNTQVFQCS